MEEYEKLKYDVLVIGAGAAGMRAAVAASDEGASGAGVLPFLGLNFRF